jgi:hypothetical protein
MWAKPTERALRLIAKRSPVVEIGAGDGYWAYLLRRIGCDVDAIDIEPTGPGVRKGSHMDADPSRTMLAVWPPDGYVFQTWLTSAQWKRAILIASSVRVHLSDHGYRMKQAPFVLSGRKGESQIMEFAR